MKQKISFYSTPMLNKTVMRLLMLPFIIAGFTIQSAKAQNNPFENLKRVAQSQDTVKSQVARVSITTANPNWKANSRPPIAFRPFELKDKNGRTMNPNEMVTLKNGKQVTAKAAIDQLNEIERKLNAQGFSLRTPQTVKVSSTVTRKEDLDGKLLSMTPPVSSLKTTEEVKKFMEPTKNIGDVVLRPYSQYTAAEKKKLQDLSFNQKNGELKAEKLANPVKEIRINPALLPLRTINETSSKDWSFGNSSTIKAGIHGDLTRYAKIYSFDPKNPFSNRSEFRILGHANIYGDIFTRHLTLSNISAEFFAPEDTSKEMTAKLIISIGGITIVNSNQSFSQYKNLYGNFGRNINQSADFEVPVLGPITVSGEIGVRGRVGMEYHGNLYRTFVSADAKPVAELTGYAEAGFSLGGVVNVGAGGNLSFVKGELDMNAYAGVWIQNAGQIVAAVSYYFGYDLEILKGNLYAYAEACVPDWVPFVGGSCSRYTHELFNWSGYHSSGTIAQGSKTYVIANL